MRDLMCLDSWYVGDPMHEKRGLSWTSGLWITVLLQISLISLYYAINGRLCLLLHICSQFLSA